MNIRAVIPVLPAQRNGLCPARTIRTFLAEDCPMMLLRLARTLANDKRTLIIGSASDGRKAFGHASSLQPDLVMTDLHMPGLDGAEATRLLKQRPNPPIMSVPFLLVLLPFYSEAQPMSPEQINHRYEN